MSSCSNKHLGRYKYFLYKICPICHIFSLDFFNKFNIAFLARAVVKY